MSLQNRIRVRLRAVFQKRTLDAEMNEELRSHIELRTQANIEAGMNPEKARRRAPSTVASQGSVAARVRLARHDLGRQAEIRDGDPEQLRFGFVRMN